MIMILSFNLSVNAQEITIHELNNNNNSSSQVFINEWTSYNTYTESPSNNLILTNAGGNNAFKFGNNTQSADGGVKRNFNLESNGDNNGDLIYDSIKFEYKVSSIYNNQTISLNDSISFIVNIFIDDNNVAFDTMYLKNILFGSDSDSASFTISYSDLIFQPTENSAVYINIVNIINVDNSNVPQSFNFDTFTITGIGNGNFLSTQEITTTNLTVFTSNKTVHISSPTDLNDSNVLIYNMNGQLVANIIESIYNDTQIDLNFLNNGMYVMILLDETGNELIKQKISIWKI